MIRRLIAVDYSRTAQAVQGLGIVLPDPHDTAFIEAYVGYLIERGYLDAGSRERAILAQRQTAQRIDIILAQLGLVQDDSLLRALSAFLDLPIVAANEFPSEPIQESALPADYLHRHEIVPLTDVDEHVCVAVADPFNTDAITSIAYLLERPIAIRLAARRDVREQLDRLYPRKEAEAIGLTKNSKGRISAHEDDIQRLRDIASEAPVIRLVNRLITSAVEQRASDIHIEPFADGLRVRFRIDGIMAEVERIPSETQAGVASRIKIVGKLNIAERRTPQDGRTSFVVSGREIDLRISTAPVLHGESIVLRILDRKQGALSLNELGFDPCGLDHLTKLLQRPNGMTLVVGPTGSGKTTTLYAALGTLNSVDRKIFTIEDPVEYQLPGINQIQIKPDIGLDFISCLRSVLRQDPDIILIGEMRDVETARTAVQASLTGHLVLSTLHTNSSAAAVTRLLDMGVDDYLLASTLSGVLSQRLVRRLCPRCSIPATLEPSLHRRLVDELGPASQPPEMLARQPVGCTGCRQTGFVGRTTIFEILTIDDLLQRCISKGVLDKEIERRARAAGMETLYQSGIRKVLTGETTLEEVVRVARF